MPKRVSPQQRRNRQALVRLTQEQQDWLEAAAFLDHVGTTEYIYGVLVAHVDALRGNRHIAQAVEVRKQYDRAKVEATPLRRLVEAVGRTESDPSQSDGNVEDPALGVPTKESGR